MFQLCSAMEFKHLPVAGGLYDQHPDLIDKFLHIFTKQAEEEQKKNSRKQAESGPRSPGRTSRPSSRR